MIVCTLLFWLHCEYELQKLGPCVLKNEAIEKFGIMSHGVNKTTVLILIIFVFLLFSLHSITLMSSLLILLSRSFRVSISLHKYLIPHNHILMSKCNHLHQMACCEAAMGGTDDKTSRSHSKSKLLDLKIFNNI
jgi:hypothetical protein